MKPENYIDLRPDASLLDANFDSYKLSVDSLPKYSHTLKSEVNELIPSNAQYGLEHAKLFSDNNYLIADRFCSNTSRRRFATVLKNRRICYFDFNSLTRKFVLYEIPFDIPMPPNSQQEQDRYPVTLNFTDKEHVFLSNGHGLLILYYTGNRSEPVPWKECVRMTPISDKDHAEPFVIVDGRCTDDGYDVLLRTVIPRAKSSTRGNFSNKAVWLVIKQNQGSDEWTSFKKCELTCCGHMDVLTFDRFPDSIVLVSTGEVDLCDGEASTVGSGDQEMADAGIAETSEAKKKYAWTQTATDVTAIFTCNETISKSDVVFSLSANSIHLSLKNNVLIGGRLGGTVETSSSTYTIDDNKLELFLTKSGGPTHWFELVVDDMNGSYEVDPESLQTASQLLERFTSETQAMGESGANTNFNTEQLEECDYSGEDISKIRWIDCCSKKVTFESDITGHNVLFFAAFDSGARYLCLRMDVDGIVWALSNDSKRITHLATFNALGYVQASKTVRRFTVCPQDCSYAAIVEARRHAYIYCQPTAVDTDLRNRKTGRRVPDLAKQHLISLTKTDEYGGEVATSDDIVGAHANDDALFILTKNDIYVIAVKGSFN